MMLRTSSRNINPFFKMIKFTLRKNLGIIILLIISALLYCPGHYLISFEQYKTSYGTVGNFGIYMLRDFMINISVISGIAVTAFSFINFTYLYQKRSSDVFHSFPLTRSELLLSRMIASFLIVFTPVVICYISYGIMGAFNIWMIASIWQLLLAFLHTLLIMLVCLSFAMVFIVCAGSAFDLCVSYIVSNAALLLVAAIIEVMLQELLVGYNGYVSNEIMGTLSPLYYCGIGLSHFKSVALYGISAKTIAFIIRSIVSTAVFTVFSVLLYNRRKAEKGGQAYAYKFIYVFCSILAGICGGYVIGYLFAQGEFNVTFFIFATVGSIITNIVYGAVTNRGFKNIKSSTIIGGASALVIPIIAVIISLGCFGFTNRLPKIEDVSATKIRYFGEDISFDDTQRAVDIHKDLLESGAILKNDEHWSENSTYIYFNYTLEDGNVMSRGFHINPSKAVDTIVELYRCDERITSVENAILSSNTKTVNFFTYLDGEEISTYLTTGEVLQLFEYYSIDIKNVDEATIMSGAEYTFDMHWDYGDFSSNYYCFEYSQKFPQTYNFIKSLNLSQRS